jgi:hypothetical protein
MNVIHMKQETVPYHRECQTWRMQDAHARGNNELSNATGFKAVQDAVYKASFYGTMPCQTLLPRIAVSTTSF